MWSLQFLGNLCAERDGKSVTLAPRKYTALLAFLALHPTRLFGRDELAAQFWPDSDDEAGRAALRTALSTLRKEFGPDLFETTSADTVCLRAGTFSTDIARFQILVQKASQAAAVPEQEVRLLSEALALYKGPLLPGIYADWAVAARERLEADHERAKTRSEVLQRIAAAESEQSHLEERFLRKAEGPAFLRLPLYNNRFIGRAPEIQQLAGLIGGSGKDTPRLITLTGPGGMGKTRLAVETAQSLALQFGGAVCFVPLSALTSGEEIGGALADALQMEAAAGNAPLQQAVFRLDDLGPSLLILDNLEHLVDSGAVPVVRTLLARLPQVTLLATSRRLLGIEGEQEFTLSPLASEPCQQLFYQHARAARPDFSGDDTLLPILCERLEGIPLAVELCAPWVRLLTPQQMLDRLNSRFRLLTSSRRDLPARHRSLHAALEEGCPSDPDLLGFFAALSVFRGGFTLAAAEAVGGDNALEYLAALRDQSLVRSDAAPSNTMPAGGQNAMRFRLLETIREFAGEKLTPETGVAARRRGLIYYHSLACSLAPRLATVDSARFFAALEMESANFRASIEFGLSDTPDSVLLAYHLMRELHWFWGIRGHHVPSTEWQALACARRSELPEPHQTWLAMDYAAYCAPEAEREPLLQETLSRFETLGDLSGVIGAHERLAYLYRRRGAYTPMEAAYRRGAEIRRTAGDLRGCGYTLANLAGSLFEQNRLAEARVLWQECREISVGFEDFGSVAVLDRAAAWAFLGDGRLDKAIPLLESAAAIFRHKGETWQLMDTLCHLGQARRQQGEVQAGQDAFAEALPLARQCGDEQRAEMLLSLLVPGDAQK